MKDFFSVLRSSSLFGGISETELRAILSCLDTKTENYPKDAFVLRPGDTVEAVGLVLEKGMSNSYFPPRCASAER